MEASIKVPDAMDMPQNATNFTALFCVNVGASDLWPDVKIRKFSGFSVNVIFCRIYRYYQPEKV